MAKNFGKILLGLTAAGAAGAGAYYWLKNRHNEEPEDEFDDSFEEDDFELDDDLGEVPERGYTTLTPTSAKEEASEEPVEKNKDAENISKSNQININFCTMDELLKLPGVNEETAAKAVSLREMLGGFNSVQEFIDMTHIEPQYVDQIREKATIRE